MFYYLASPYNHPDLKIKELRHNIVRTITGCLLELRIPVYSPIVHNVSVFSSYQLPETHEFWLGFDFEMLAKAAGLIVLHMDGTDDSVGVYAEVVFAISNKIPIYYIRLNHKMPYSYSALYEAVIEMLSEYRLKQFKLWIRPEDKKPVEIDPKSHI